MHHPSSDRLQLYVDQRLGDGERLSLDMHLVACAHCSQQVRTLRQLLTGLESMRELSLPADFAVDMAEEVAPSEGLAVAPARRLLLIQAGICLIILLTSGALLTIVDTPVTDPSDDVLGAVDVLLGSPFQADANIVAVLAIMALAGIAAVACVLGSAPKARPQRRDAVPSHLPRRRR
jgi:anti-sigma factor RsiW